MSQEKLISIGQFFMEPLQLVCKELNTQEVLLVLFSIYSQVWYGTVLFKVAGENSQALFLNDGPENISKDI